MQPSAASRWPSPADPTTYASCSAVSMAPGRARRTCATAHCGGTPSSTRRRPAMVPVRPSPPRQCRTMALPEPRHDRRTGPASAHRASNTSSGMLAPTIGRWNHGIPRARTASPIPATSQRLSSWSSMSVTTAAAPQSRIQSRSTSRSRSHGSGYFLPGQKVMPICPPPGNATASMVSGWDRLVCFAVMTSSAPRRRDRIPQ